jgi:hypothetical protein
VRFKKERQMTNGFREIATDVVLGNMLLYISRVTVRDLKRFRGIMSIKCPDLYVDITDDGQVGAVCDNHDMFAESDGVITAGKRLSKKRVDIEFNCYVPRDVLKAIQAACRKVQKTDAAHRN